MYTDDREPRHHHISARSTEQCYNTTPGAAYAKQRIVSVQLSVPGAATSGAVDVTLVSVVENP